MSEILNIKDWLSISNGSVQFTVHSSGKYITRISDGARFGIDEKVICNHKDNKKSIFVIIKLFCADHIHVNVYLPGDGEYVDVFHHFQEINNVTKCSWLIKA